MELMSISKLRKPIGMDDHAFYRAWFDEARAAIDDLNARRMKFMYNFAAEYKLTGAIEFDCP